jgi:hypothetical protein
VHTGEIWDYQTARRPAPSLAGDLSQRNRPFAAGRILGILGTRSGNYKSDAGNLYYKGISLVLSTSSK